MRGHDVQQPILFSYVALEDRIPQSHPLRPIRQMVDRVLADLSADFDALYASGGRPSIPPERLLRALLIQIFYSVRSERQLMEQLDYNLLFRWFVGLPVDDRVWDPTVFTKNRDRLLEGDVARSFLHGVVEEARHRRLLSEEHFSVDGTLLEAWASQKSFRPKDEQPSSEPRGRNEARDFRGERRSNETHASRTDPDARLARKKGKEALLAYCGSVLMENRSGLLVDAEVRHATGRAEVESALAMLARQPRGSRRRTVGADKLYDTREFVASCRAMGVTPHVAQNKNAQRRSMIDGRTTRHVGYARSQQARKRVEEPFGWGKTVGLLHKLRHRGLALVDWVFSFTAAAYNLVCMRRLIVGGVCP